MANFIYYTDNLKGGKLTVLNLDTVCKFRETNEVTPRVEISFPCNPDRFETIPYLWKDLLKKLGYED